MTGFPPPTNGMSEETGSELASQFRDLVSNCLKDSVTQVSENGVELALIESTLLSKVLNYTIKVCNASFLTKWYLANFVLMVIGWIDK
jgi:hypothetical protein